MPFTRILAIVAAALLVPAPSFAQVITSPAIVIDGDTLTLTGQRIRLFGIDAPEHKQSCNRAGTAWACGEEATQQLRALVGGKPITCTAKDIDVYGRTVAICHADRLDLGQLMVSAGLATSLTSISDAYADNEATAKNARLGIWGSIFETPSAWRAANRVDQTVTIRKAAPPRQVSRASAPQTRFTNTFGCAIKGNRSYSGKWIYHLPGMEHYEETRPEELFCTESAAQAAGYRRSRSG